MSVFSTYVFILIIILLVYYAIVILWEIKRPRTSDDKTHDDIAGDDANVFGYTKMYVIENPSLDGTFCVSEDENYYFATDYDESLEETGDSPEEICLDDEDLLEEESEESKAAYESLKAIQEQMKAVQPSYEEDYQGDEFAVMMAQPMESSQKIIRHIMMPTEERSPTDYELEDWIYYARVDFELDASFIHLQICLHINRRTYKKDLEAKDARECMTFSDYGIIASYISSWWYRSQLAVKYFRDEIIAEHEIVRERGEYCGYIDAPNVWNVEVRDINVSDLWFDVKDCCVRRTGYDEYRICAIVDDEPLQAKLSDEDVNLYLKKDKDGNYTREVIPQQLMVKYFFHHITKRNPKNDDFVRVVDSYTPYPGPVFRMDDKFYMTDEAKAVIFGGSTKIICVNSDKNRTYYLEACIYGIKRSVELDRRVVLDLLELNEKLEFTHKKSPDDIAGYYFGHELVYLQNGHIPDRIEERVHVKHSYYKPESKLFPEFFDYEDYPDTDYFNILKIDPSKVEVLWNNHRTWNDIQEFTLKIVIGGWHFEFNITYNDIYNYLERDANGKYTRRVSVEQLSSKYIKKYAGMVKMYEAGVPIAIIARVLDFQLSEVKKIIESLGVVKADCHTDNLDDATRKNIIEEYSEKAELTELKEKYGFTEYATLYRILGNRAMGKNTVFPEEFTEFVNCNKDA